MRKSQILLGSLAFLSMGLYSCSSDEPANPGGEVSTKDQSFYMKVALMDVNSASRAADTNEYFEEGTPEENNIANLQFKFYDAAGNQIFQQTVQNPTFTDSEWSVGKVNVTTIKVDVNQGDNMPAYVVCFANPVVWTSEDGQNPAVGINQMQGLRNLTRNAFKGTQGNYAMNNAVYFGNDPISGAQNVKMVGAPIQRGQLFTSEAAANAAAEGDAVAIHIERYAAKVKVSVAANATANATNNTVGDYTLTFNPEYVGLTADAANMYAVKRFSTVDGDNAPIPSFNDVQTALGTWTSWNDAPLFRSYWACSPSYYATEFPSVSDNIIDQAAAGTGAGALVGNYKLKYYSYNQIAGDNADGHKAITAGASDPVVLYGLENTMGAQAFKSRNPKAAAPSVLLLGNTTLSNGGTAIAAGTTFYIWNNKVYFGNSVPTGAATGAQTIYNAMLASQSVLAKDTDGTKLTADDLTTSNVAVVHPAKATRDVTGVLLAEDLVTLQINSVGAGEIYYKPTGSDTWVVLPTGDTKEAVDALNYVNRQLAGQLNYAHAYTSGKCYYTIPIQHLGYTENTANHPEVDGVLDWEKVRVGDFGLVRNHVYHINITNINGYGSGILDLDNPIVTPMETNSYWIKYSLRVLNWRYVPTQNVVLP